MEKTGFRIVTIVRTIVAIAGLTVGMSGALRANHMVQPASQGTSVHGPAAISHLQQEGQYKSLQEAYRKARYAIRGEGQSRWSWNPAHGLSSRFSGRGLQLTVQQPVQAEETINATDSSGYQSRVQLLSLCLLYTSPSPRDATLSRMPSSA